MTLFSLPPPNARLLGLLVSHWSRLRVSRFPTKVELAGSLGLLGVVWLGVLTLRARPLGRLAARPGRSEFGLFCLCTENYFAHHQYIAFFWLCPPG